MSESIIDFLVEAKKHTYASEGDDASVFPLLPGSRQLEYRRGAFFYRDIYFGFAYFVGQETVYKNEQPCWSMTYTGGVDRSIVNSDDARRIYAFLRSALRQVSREDIFRGPAEYTDGGYKSQNAYQGDFYAFHGKEIILHKDKVVYELHYSGGVLR